MAMQQTDKPLHDLKVLVTRPKQRAAGLCASVASSQAGWSTYEGWKVKGVPVATIVRGEVVAENGVVVGERGFGEFVSFLK